MSYNSIEQTERLLAFMVFRFKNDLLTHDAGFDIIELQ